MPKRAIKIEKDAWYTLSDIVRHKFFPWANSFSTVRRVVEMDKASKNILKCTSHGAGTGTKYHFKVDNIIKFLEAVENGTAKL